MIDATVIERFMRDANPIPGVDAVDADEFARFVAAADTRRAAFMQALPQHETRPTSSARPSRRRLVWVVAAAFIGVLVGIGITLLAQRGGEAPVGDEPDPTVKISTHPFTEQELAASAGAEWSTMGAQNGVVYVDSVDKVLMFGGDPDRDGNGVAFRPNDQTLWIDPATLTAQRVDTASPPPRAYHAMAYDRQSDRVILFGGRPPDEDIRQEPYEDTYSDTWAFDPATGTWEQMHPAQSPPPSSYHDMVYHPAADRVVLVGGEVWTYDYEADTWDMASSMGPPWHGYIPGGAAVDESSGLIVTVTTSCDPDCGVSTRGFDLTTNLWDANPRASFLDSGVRIDGDTLASVVGEIVLTAVVYEPSSQRIIGYGAVDRVDQASGIVFAYSQESETWTHIGSGPHPGALSPMVYDPARSQIVVLATPLDERSEGWQMWTAPTHSLGYEPIGAPGSITISVQDWSGVEGYRLLAGVWSEAPGELVGGAFWTMVDSDPFSITDVVHPPYWGDDEADNYESWGAGDYLWDETALLEPGTYRIEFWANPGELKPYGSYIPTGSPERTCWVDVEVNAGETSTVVVSDIPRDHEPCPLVSS